MDLFDQNRETEPLAARMRPRTINEYIGQDHIMGPGRLLRRAIRADQLSSLLFYGPPGTGKTTLARVIAGTTKSRFITLNAVLSGIKQIREAIDEAVEVQRLYGKKTILFVDEVHRWNKAQQDALLPWVENGTVVLVGATTENPFFEVNSALVSRSRVFQLKQLTEKNLQAIALQALEDKERGYGRFQVQFDQKALEHIIHTASGDARSLLNAIELAVETTPEKFPPLEGSEINIDLSIAEESIQKKVVLYDKEGDYHYDTISAFIKSIRGSDPDAAIYWLARMVRAGEHPRFLFRRMIISAAEDVGLADPRAIGVVESAAAAFERIGMPEGNFLLSEAALYLATCPKSNSTMAIFDAIKAVEEEAAAEVPNHLRDGSRDKHGFGHGEGYQYPHAFRDHWAAQQYLPNGITGRIFFHPSRQGYEAEIQETVLRRREAQLAAMIENESREILTFSPKNKSRDAWIRRTDSCRAHDEETLRKVLFEGVDIARHHRILICSDPKGLLLLEAFRRIPEGGLWALIPQQSTRELLAFETASLPPAERPFLLPQSLEEIDIPFLSEDKEEIQPEIILGQNSLTRSTDKPALLRKIFTLMAPGGSLGLSEILPRRSTRLSSLLPKGALPDELFEQLQQMEEALFTCQDNPLVNWTSNDLLKDLEKIGFKDIKDKIHLRKEKRRIIERQREDWLTPKGPNSYGQALAKHFSSDEKAILATAFLEKIPADVTWESSTLVFHARKPGE